MGHEFKNLLVTIDLKDVFLISKFLPEHRRFSGMLRSPIVSFFLQSSLITMHLHKMYVCSSGFCVTSGHPFSELY